MEHIWLVLNGAENVCFLQSVKAKVHCIRNDCKYYWALQSRGRDLAMVGGWFQAEKLHLRGGSVQPYPSGYLSPTTASLVSPSWALKLRLQL